MKELHGHPINLSAQWTKNPSNNRFMEEYLLFVGEVAIASLQVIYTETYVKGVGPYINFVKVLASISTLPDDVSIQEEFESLALAREWVTKQLTTAIF